MIVFGTRVHAEMVCEVGRVVSSSSVAWYLKATSRTTSGTATGTNEFNTVYCS